MPIEAAVKIVLDLGYDLGNNPALSDYKKAFINAINDLASKDLKRQGSGRVLNHSFGKVTGAARIMD